MDRASGARLVFSSAQLFRHRRNGANPLDVDIRSVDDSLPEDSPLRWGKMFAEIGEKSGRPFDIQDRMEGKIGDTGFINVQKQEYKVPIGTWPQLKVYKDAGRVNKTQILQGMEGW